jgi:hypothetical protein
MIDLGEGTYNLLHEIFSKKLLGGERNSYPLLSKEFLYKLA